MRKRGLTRLVVPLCVLVGASSALATPGAKDSREVVIQLAKARAARLTLELEYVATEIRQGLLFSSAKVGPAIERMQDDPKGTCADNARRICEAYAEVSPTFGKAWTRYVEGDCRGALEAIEPTISLRDTSYFSAAKRFVQAQAFVGAAEAPAGSEAYLDLVRDMPERFCFSSLALLKAGETFEASGRRYYAMSVYRLWAETFGVMNEAMAAEVTARADRIEADYREPLKTIAEKMSKVNELLDQADSGQVNQQAQQDILEQLDDLIALIEEQDSEATTDDENSTSDGDTKPAGGATQATSPPPPPTRRKTTGPDVPADGSDDWGRLPPAERAKLLSTFSESMPERYREMIRDYFARLARSRGE